MNHLQITLFAICVLTVSALSAQPEFEPTASDSASVPTGFYLYSDQDRFFDKYNEDRNYTLGANIGIFGPIANKNYLGAPWLRKQVDKLFGVAQKHCKNNQLAFPNFSVFGGGFTPLNLDSVSPIIGDRPYASLLAVASTFVSADNLKGIAIVSELNIGMLGLGIAPKAQTYIHENHWLGSTREVPRGWHNQISDGGEPTIMYRIGFRKRVIEQKWKLQKWSHIKRFQVVTTGEGMLGYYTNASIGVEAKFGFFSNNFWEMASGISLGSNQGAREKGGQTPFVEAYVFAALRQRAVGYNALLQGQFRKTAYRMGAPDIERLIGEYDFGLGVKIWKINLQWGIVSGRSPEYRGAQARPHIWGGFLLRAAWNIDVKLAQKDCSE